VGERQGTVENLVMQAARNPDPSFWSGKRVLLTGHTGFKGSWLALWLRRLGADVVGIALPPITTPSLFGLAAIDDLIDSRIGDIRDAGEMARQVRSSAPDVVFHLAAQALVRTSYDEPLPTFATNVQGTANVLEAVRGSATTRVVVAITTDKVYRNVEQIYPYRETDPLGGHDPYSASKAAAEIVIASYRDSYLAAQGVAVASARAGNVIGGGDWSTDRLIPDAVRAWSMGQPLSIRRPQAFRPWQHVLEPLAGYLKLAERLWAEPALAGAYNFGPPTHEAASVREVVLLAQQSYGSGDVTWGEGNEGPHEAGWLALETAKALHVLGIAPRWPLRTTVQRTMDWYRRQQEGRPACDLCVKDIVDFEAGAVPASLQEA
jgi:CDP-glucose 4,6-dehydratase